MQACPTVQPHLGLLVEVRRFLVDVPRTTSVTRYFLARRHAGGDGLWEAQAVWLVPLDELWRVATSPYDAPILAALPPVRKSVARSRSASGSGNPCGTDGSGGDRQ
jgi:hypothetical protein